MLVAYADSELSVLDLTLIRMRCRTSNVFA